MATRLTWKDKALAATHGTQFGAIITCALGRKATVGPRFVGKATLTSDRFLMCDFIGRNGQYRFGAFVGSFDDLARNYRGLSTHLKLNEKDRASFRRVLATWAGEF